MVDNFVELNALQRVFREAKFCTQPDDDEVSASPIVAMLFEKLMATLIEVEVEEYGEDMRERWVKWLAIDEPRDEWYAAIRRARANIGWANYSFDEREKYARLLLSPFTMTPDRVAKFILAVNQIKE